mmetsp:Transcript_12260/g.18521  ORF Transcript_12260/g.18521 Transcript_12260/m.18521 type:complete len:415 (+) Transcript_12260:166-1410(+)
MKQDNETKESVLSSLDEQIRQLQAKRENTNRIAFGVANKQDDFGLTEGHSLGQTLKKSLATGSSRKRSHPTTTFSSSSLHSYNAPQSVFDEFEQLSSDEDDASRRMITKANQRKISERESDYHKRKYNRRLALDNDSLDPSERYRQAMIEAELEREEKRIDEAIARKKRQKTSSSTSTSTTTTSSTIQPVTINVGSKFQPNFNQKSHHTSSSSSSSSYQWGKPQTSPENQNPPVPKEKPCYTPSGKLAAETRRVGDTGVTLLFAEPSDAAKPIERWRLYVFVGDKELPFIALHHYSYYLFGRDHSVADIPIDHVSCSKQHAVIQFRAVDPSKRRSKTKKRRSKTTTESVVKNSVHPYIMDLKSTNHTFLNGKRIKPSRYIQLLEHDTLQFGSDQRKYVLLNVDQQLSKNSNQSI